MLNRRSLTAALLAAAAITPAFGHPHEQLLAEQHGDIERQLTKFRSDLKDATAARDIVKLRAMYADGFTHTHGSGKVDGKDARLVALMAGDPVIETAAVTEMSISIHGTEMAIMTGRSAIPNKRDARDYDYRWMQVYTRASGDWQLAASQATRLPVAS